MTFIPKKLLSFPYRANYYLEKSHALEPGHILSGHRSSQKHFWEASVSFPFAFRRTLGLRNRSHSSATGKRTPTLLRFWSL